MADTTTQTPFAPPPSRSPVLDPATGLMRREWLTWLDLSWRRQGGANAPSNADLDSSLSGTQGTLSQTQEDLTQTQEDLTQTQGDLTQTQGDLASTQAVVEALQAELDGTQTEVTALSTRVTTLESTVTTLRTELDAAVARVAALEAHLAAIVAAVPASAVSVTALPTLTDTPASADALRDNLTSAWEPPLEANDTALASLANGLRSALLATAP